MRQDHLVNIFLLYAALVALGAMGGYMAFYASFNHRFVGLLENAEQRHNSSRQELLDRYTKILSDLKKCLEDETKVLEISELRGRLDGLVDLSGKHQVLLDKYHKSQTIQAHVQTTSRQLQARIEAKNSIIAEFESQIRALNERIEQMERQTEKEDELKEKENEIKILKNEQHHCQATQLSTKYNVQRHQDFLCREKHGKGPYYVQFLLKFRGDIDSFSFVVELPSRKQLPHSVLTFLSLVESNFYDGTTFLSTPDRVLLIDSKPGSSAFLENKLRTLGLGGDSALSFAEEASSFHCGIHSVGFVGLGPALEVHLSDDFSRNRHACFGRIVRGLQILSRVEQVVGRGEFVDILGVRHLALDL